MSGPKCTPSAPCCLACTAVPRSLEILCLAAGTGTFRAVRTGQSAANAEGSHVKQGCLYDFNGRAVIALKSGTRVPVEYVEPVTVFADAADLVPLAMRYFHGMVSK